MPIIPTLEKMDWLDPNFIQVLQGAYENIFELSKPQSQRISQILQSLLLESQALGMKPEKNSPQYDQWKKQSDEIYNRYSIQIKSSLPPDKLDQAQSIFGNNLFSVNYLNGLSPYPKKNPPSQKKS